MSVSSKRNARFRKMDIKTIPPNCVQYVAVRPPPGPRSAGLNPAAALVAARCVRSCRSYYAELASAEQHRPRAFRRAAQTHAQNPGFMPQIHPKIASSFASTFGIDFGPILGLKMEPRSIQNRFQHALRFRSRFLINFLAPTDPPKPQKVCSRFGAVHIFIY